MKINGLIPGMPGASSSGVVDQIMQVEKLPLEAARQRREKIVSEKNEYKSFSGLVEGLGSALEGLKSPMSFAKMKLESSHPDIINGVAQAGAQIGSWNMEVRDLARVDRHLAFGLPDADKTEVGFGWLAVEGAGGAVHEIVIDPGATLNDVASKINAAGAGVKAMVVNSGIGDEPWRLMVSSERTGEAARISIDADTTFLDFREQVRGRNLDIKFEDMDVSRATNDVPDLLGSVSLKANKAAPGTNVQVSVSHDIDATMSGIKTFAEKYNQIAGYVHQQSKIDPATKLASGQIASDSSVRTVMRSLQSNISGTVLTEGKFRSLADVGITTNAKTGELNVDEGKLKAALAEDYDGVTKIFARTETGPGVADRLSEAVKNLQNSQTGALGLRQKSLDKVIRSQDQVIERQMRRMEERESQLRSQFDRLQSKMTMLQGQQDFLAARFGGASSGAEMMAASPQKAS